MADVKFTLMQSEAISLRDKNILVSAAAGSGKTAVLVERIIQRVLDSDNPIDIDRILVMTFTKAAAAQMKEKILKAIDEKLRENPEDEHIQKQYVLVHNASIMTIDSFCMSVVKNHFEEIGISPDFRMADEGEIRLLKQDVLEDVLEKYYEEGDEEFLNMTEVLSLGKTDQKLEDIIFDLYTFSQSYPVPFEYLDNCDNEYRNISVDGFDHIKWVNQYANQTISTLKNLYKKLDEAANYCNYEFGPKAYEPGVEEVIKVIDKLLINKGSDNEPTYSRLYENALSISDEKIGAIGRLSLPKEGTIPDEELAERAKLKDKVAAIRKEAKESVEATIKELTANSPEDVVSSMKLMSSTISMLIKVTKDFTLALNEKKRSKNVADFNDVAHFCLEILKNGKDTTAREYSEFYKEIYIDEYQDSSLLQEELLKYLARDEHKLFMVGDVKQSIYGFRLARPQIFVDKYNKYADVSKKDTESDIRIDLSHNFRSRNEVLESVNSVFEYAMTKELGGIEYDEAAKLRLGANYKELDVDNTTELNMMIKSDDVNDREAEAYMVARRIKDLMANHRVEDGSENGRPLKYSDIAILLRSSKGWDNVFMNILENEGIPVHVASAQGYFLSFEIKILLEYLKIIDNPLQDIPLTAVMLSVIGGFTEEELSIIRGANKEGYLFDSLIKYKETYNDTGDESSILSSHIEKFVERLNYYRRKSEYNSVEEMLTEIIDDEYGRIIAAMPNGKKRTANLNMLLNQAKEYGKTSFKGIFHFNRYIEALKKYDIDFGEANILDETDDTVRIVTVHKSKGLEYPVVFLCGMSKKFNTMDLSKTVLTDSEYGLATDVIDIKRRVKYPLLFKGLIKNKKKIELISEELRLLYVAMTRAKEKLIMTGVVKDEEEIDESNIDQVKINSYLDVYKYAYGLNKSKTTSEPDSGAINIDDAIRTSYVTAEDITVEKTFEESGLMARRERLLSILNKNASKNTENEDAFDAISDIIYCINYEYPYQSEKKAVKISVSELKHRSYETSETSDSTLFSDFEDEINAIGTSNTISSEEQANSHSKKDNSSEPTFGALHGSAVHRVFELWDYTRYESRESVESFLKYIEEEKLMEDELMGIVNVDEILAFVTSDIAKRMKIASFNDNLYREQPFVISEDLEDPESTLIQGIIDAYFYEDDEIVLVDYKTDKGKTAEKLIADHKIQLDYYADALERMLGTKVKEKIIYSTELKKSIAIDHNT